MHYRIFRIANNQIKKDNFKFELFNLITSIFFTKTIMKNHNIASMTYTD